MRNRVSVESVHKNKSLTRIVAGVTKSHIMIQ